MRARLYRGPHDGRVLEVPNHQRDIRLMRKRARQSPYVYLPADQPEFITVETVEDEYRIVWIDNGDMPSFAATHPDGSVYFEWTKKRGTRIER